MAPEAVGAFWFVFCMLCLGQRSKIKTQILWSGRKGGGGGHSNILGRYSMLVCADTLEVSFRADV